MKAAPAMISSVKRTTRILTACLALAGATGALGQGFEEASQGIDQRLRDSLRELARTRDEIAKAKIPLSREVSKLENEVLALRRDRDRLLKISDSSTIDLGALRRQVESLGEQEEFIDSRLTEFVRDFESRLDISELPRFEAITARAKLAEKKADLDPQARRDAQLDVVTAAQERLEGQLGGQVYAGEALGPDGVLTQGKFVSLGPTVFYASEDGAVTGLVENQLNAADPVVAPLPASLSAGIVALARKGSGTLPLDATLGKALKKAKARKSLMQYIDDGGPVGYVICGLGLAAVLLTAVKAFEILRFPVADPDEVDTILEELGKGNRDAAAWHAQRIEGVAGDMLVTGVEHAEDSRGILEELLFERILRVRPTLERFLPFLAITAAAAPLLGLLGTVIGMIETFQLITVFGTGDAKSLSSGISAALITTALGLIVAIPTLILHGGLARMAKRKLGLLEEVSLAFVNGADAIRHRRQREAPGA